MKEVEVGAYYHHFKGHIYKIIAIAKNSETLEDMVVYGDDNDIWVRPYKMFIEEVDHQKYPEVKQKYRFEKIQKKVD